MKYNVNKMVKLAMLSAMGLMLMMLIRFPIIPAAPFLEYEPGDVPALVGAFLFGPGAGFMITAIVSIIQGFTVSAGSGWIGALMHIIATGIMVVVASNIYKRMHTLKGSIIGLIAGSACMTLIMIPLNLVLTTLFLNVPFDVVKAMIIPAIIPFNLFKTATNSIITIFVYKAVGKVLKVEVNTFPYTSNDTQKI
ncbi:ECF transporter S component [Marinisporobacter balticus]|uniref:Riboflavin transporter n=1 Tax=Marinisporobacter balticus TaxID=2018667 RepID=A0A4R2L1A3_9FIRM|nr:ECF transporter S component [Marinisporobacter balticus]TCO78957.1 riboflavin transporter FmnP [Marinisporobacter balticus]